jgi:hypothetical protein
MKNSNNNIENSGVNIAEAKLENKHIFKKVQNG